jgi:hypothetical protein
MPICKTYFILFMIKTRYNLNRHCRSYWFVFYKTFQWDMVFEPCFKTLKNMLKSSKSQITINILRKECGISKELYKFYK